MFKRNVWLYRNANGTELCNIIIRFDWNCLNRSPVDEAVEYFNISSILKFYSCVNTIKEVTVKSDDKPWSDNEIRRFSRKRDRLKTAAKVLKVKDLKTGENIKTAEIKSII